MRVSGESGEPCELIYRLDHQYTETNFSMKDLKAADQARARALKHFADELEFSIYLAALEKSVLGGCDDDYGGGYGRYHSRWDDDEDEEDSDNESLGGGHHGIVDVCETQITLKRLIDLD